MGTAASPLIIAPVERAWYHRGMMNAAHSLFRWLSPCCVLTLVVLAGCEAAESAPKADAVSPGPEAPPSASAEPLDLGELDGAVHQLESALDLLMTDRHGADGRPLSFPEDPPPVVDPPAPFDISALIPSAPPPEPIVDGLPPEDTVPADVPGGLLRIWSEGEPDQPVAMTDSVHREVALLRRDIQRLNNNLESLLEHYVGSLHEENERLRQEIQRLYVMRMQEGRFDAAVPRPNQGVLDSLREDALMGAAPPMDLPGPGTGRVTTEPVPMDGGPGAAPASEPEPPPLEDGPGVMAMAAFGGTQYAIVEEWGRTPEEARSFGEGVSSLKGLILAVPPGVASEDLEELAYHLREEYDAFDNINVKVFEGLEAAQKYARSNEVTPDLLVADVTRHAATQRDLILLQQGGEMTVLPGPGGEPVEPSELPDLEAAAGAEGHGITLTIPSQAEHDAAETRDEPAGTEPAIEETEEDIPLLDEEEPVPILVPADEYDADAAS